MALTLDARPNVLHHTSQSATLTTPQQQPNVLRPGLTLDRDRVLRPPAGRARGAIQLRPYISDLPDQVTHMTPPLGVARLSAPDRKDTGLDRPSAMIRKDGYTLPKYGVTFPNLAHGLSSFPTDYTTLILLTRPAPTRFQSFYLGPYCALTRLLRCPHH